MKSHLFITGRIQTGKSTILNKTIEFLRNNAIIQGHNLICGGFKTIGLGQYVYIMSVDETLANCEEDNIVSVRYLLDSGYKARTEIFDNLGSELVTQNKDADIIVMDELGFMESDAIAFQRSVLEALDADIPVLGVIKPRSNHFLEKVRTHSKVELINIDILGREASEQQVLSWAEEAFDLFQCREEK